MAVTIVENDAVTFAKGFGIPGPGQTRDRRCRHPVSNRLDRQGFHRRRPGHPGGRRKLSWDDKVTVRLPGFQMYDPWVTREMTLRDLLVHRSGLGLGEGDLLFVPRTISAAPSR